MEKERSLQAEGARGVWLGALVPLVLASGSPRRAEILRAVGWPFEASAPDVDESRREGERAEDYVRRLAREKAEAGARPRLFGLVLGADTVVVVERELLGKPRDEADARRMLRALSGRWHEVLTGVALVRAESGRALVGVERTRVRFAEMSDEEIDWHVATGEPLDKAGAYAVQGIGAMFIDSIHGSYTNVVGLPLATLFQMLRRAGIEPLTNNRPEPKP
jgi:septum formation protein